MFPAFTYSHLAPDAIERLGHILAQCFSSPREESSPYFQKVGMENFRTISQSETLLGGLATIPMAQWWGGRRVPMTGIAAVGIAPEYRGSGGAIALMRSVLQELHEKQVPLSVLYAATQRLYRKAGYEQGGFACKWEVATGAIEMRERSLPVTLVEPLTTEAFFPIQQRFARLANGHLDRHSALWDRLLFTQGADTYGYFFGPPDQPQGYVLFTQRDSTMQVKDWALLTPAAYRTFWSFITDHRSILKTVQWKASAVDPLMLLPPEEDAKPLESERWMLRIIHVPLALTQRGYPAPIQTELHLEVFDDVITDNNGKFVLKVSGGKGEVIPGGRGDLKLDIRGLAPLYSGLFSAQQLASLGYLEGSEEVLAIATPLFAGPCPWMPDFF
jgi:predicted acetyltransferase